MAKVDYAAKGITEQDLTNLTHSIVALYPSLRRQTGLISVASSTVNPAQLSNCSRYYARPSHPKLVDLPAAGIYLFKNREIEILANAVHNVRAAILIVAVVYRGRIRCSDDAHIVSAPATAAFSTVGAAWRVQISLTVVEPEGVNSVQWIVREVSIAIPGLGIGDVHRRDAGRIGRDPAALRRTVFAEP